MLCAKCGEQNLDDARFCKNCGASLEKVSPPPPPPAAPTRSPLEGLGSPTEAPKAADTVFFSTPATGTEKTATPPQTPPPPPPPVTAPTETMAGPPEQKIEAAPPQTPPPPPPPVTAPTEAVARPPEPIPDAASPPPPPRATLVSEQATAPQKKSTNKTVFVCLTIVGIVFLLFMLLIMIGMCAGNTATSYLSSPGDSYNFTVDVSQPVQVTFEVPENAQFNVTITGPQGDLVGEWTITPYNNVFMLQRNGTYSFTVYSIGGSGWWKARW